MYICTHTITSTCVYRYIYIYIYIYAPPSHPLTSHPLSAPVHPSALPQAATILGREMGYIS